MSRYEEEENMPKMVFRCPKYHCDKLRKISIARKISMSRLVAFAIDNELEKDRPFSFSTDIPDDDFIEGAYADEAGRILEFIRGLRKGAGLDILLLLRHKMNIPDKSKFLGGMRELLLKEMIEYFTPPHNPMYNGPYDCDYLYYRVKNNVVDRKKLSKNEKDYKRFLALQKKFSKDKEL